MNWSRQSTVGWSIGNVLLDLSGGLLAFSQQAIEAYRKGSTSEFTSNIAKLLLSVESVGFDLLFIVQHYVVRLATRCCVEKPGQLP
jgi:cystinosin